MSNAGSGSGAGVAVGSGCGSVVAGRVVVVAEGAIVGPSPRAVGPGDPGDPDEVVGTGLVSADAHALPASISASSANKARIIGTTMSGQYERVSMGGLESD